MAIVSKRARESVFNSLAGHPDGDGRATRHDSAKEGLAEDAAELGKASWKSEERVIADWRL